MFVISECTVERSKMVWLKKPCHLRSNVNFVGKNHHIYLNNFFSTIKLAYDLFKDVIYCCTMAQANRKDFLKDLATTSLLVKCLK